MLWVNNRHAKRAHVALSDVVILSTGDGLHGRSLPTGGRQRMLVQLISSSDSLPMIQLHAEVNMFHCLARSLSNLYRCSWVSPFALTRFWSMENFVHGGDPISNSGCSASILASTSLCTLHLLRSYPVWRSKDDPATRPWRVQRAQTLSGENTSQMSALPGGARSALSTTGGGCS